MLKFVDVKKGGKDEQIKNLNLISFKDADPFRKKLSVQVTFIGRIYVIK